MKNALGVLFLLIMTSCSSKNSYTTFDFTEQGNSMASYRMIQIKSTATKFNSNTTKPIFRGSPTEAGKLTDTFHLPKTGIYYLDLSTQVFPVIIEQGGLLKLKVVNSGRVPEIKFEGANSTINNFSFENTKCLIEQLLNQPMNRFDQQSEAQILAAVKKYRSASDKLFSEKGAALPDSFAQRLKVENEAAVMNYLMYYRMRSARNSDKAQSTPLIDELINAFDFNNEQNFNHSAAYRIAVYEFYKRQFQLDNNSGIGLDSYVAFLTSKKCAPPIKDYVISVYATNYFIGESIRPEIAQKSYDFVLPLVTDVECRMHLYEALMKTRR